MLKSLLVALILFGVMLAALPDAPPRPLRHDETFDQDGRSPALEDFTSRRPNLVLIVIDTLRHDASGGAGRAMPTLARLASKGLACPNAYAPSAWTPPSMTSLLTGLMPREHGCHGHGNPMLAPSVVTYAEVLRSTYGYETVAFSDAPWFRGSKASVLQGFRRGRDGSAIVGLRELPNGVTLFDAPASIDHWLGERDASRPFAMLLHTFDAHEPYGPENHAVRAGSPPEEIRAFEEAIRLWDVAGVTSPAEKARVFFTNMIGRSKITLLSPLATHEVNVYLRSGYREDPDPGLAQHLRTEYERGCAWVDTGLARTFEALRDRHLLENTLLVVTSDHGEAFGEHGTLGHGHNLHGETARIPLVMSGPAPFDTPRVVRAAASLLDVFPTFFDWAGLRLPPDVAGRSLVPAALGNDMGDTVVESEHFYVTGGPEHANVHAVTLSHADWRYFLDYDVAAGTIAERLFEVVRDAAELHDLARDGQVHGVVLPKPLCDAIDRTRTWMWEQAEDGASTSPSHLRGTRPTIQSEPPRPCAAGSR